MAYCNAASKNTEMDQKRLAVGVRAGSMADGSAFEKFLKG